MRARLGIPVATVLALALLPFAVGGETLAHASVDRAAAPAATKPAPKPAPKAKPTPVVAVPVRSSYETATRVISRDIGLSVALPDGHDLWLFGDTGMFQRSLATSKTWDREGFIDGSTAMLSGRARGQVPRGVEFPSAKPTRFVPVPKRVYMPNGSGKVCAKPTPTAAFPARWPSGAAVMPTNTSEVLVTYSIVCVTHPSNAGATERAEGWGYLLYNWKKRHVDRGPVDVFAPKKNGAELDASLRLGWPIVTGSRLTLFSSTCTQQFIVCASGSVWSVTMPATVAALDNPASYKPVPMLTDGSAQWQPLSISVGRYVDGLKLVEQTGLSGAYTLFEAPSLTSPWHAVRSAKLPDCVHKNAFCFGLEGHPELSTSAQVFVSYKDPNAGPDGHAVLSSLPN